MSTVDAFMADLEHPFKAGIEAYRSAILASNGEITEQVKWNAPSFCFEGEDRVTFRLQPKGICQLVFHRGAKVRDDVDAFVFDDPTGLMEWKTQDRGTVTFANPQDMAAKQATVVDLVNRWAKAS